MNKMNWNRSFKLLAVVVAVALLVGAVGTAVAFTFSGEVTESAEANSQERFDVTLEDPFSQTDNWTVRAESELDDATVDVEARTPGAQVVFEERGDGAVEHPVNIADGLTSVTVDVNGGVPEITEFDYENPEVENVTALRVIDLDRGETLGTWEMHRFTDGSQSARTAIDQASETVDEAGSDDARSRLDEAITLYNNAEFDEAIRIAEDAEDIAEGEGETRQMLLIVGGLLAVVVAAGGVAYYMRTRQQPQNKLR